jgi:O-antigen/teichoic acid export membrane protein
MAGRLAEHLNSDLVLLWVVLVMLGQAPAGLFAACLAVWMAANPLLLAVSLIVMPNAGRAYGADGVLGVRRVIGAAMLYTSAPLVALVALMQGLRAPLMGALFDGRFAGTDDALVMLAMCLPLSVAGTIAGAGLLVLQRPGLKAASSAFGTASLVALALALIPAFGLVGAACSLAGARLLETSARVLMLSFAGEPDFALSERDVAGLVTPEA